MTDKNKVINGVIQTKPLRATDGFVNVPNDTLNTATVGDYWHWA